jgi:hypothetical protein
MSTLSQFFITQPTVADLGVGNTPDLGGIIIRKESGVAWIVSPHQAEVSRTWTNRNDANTVAQSCTGCTGWFVPTFTQLQNPGYLAREYWGGYSSSNYWSSTERNASNACYVSFTEGGARAENKTATCCVRAFRCVTF